MASRAGVGCVLGPRSRSQHFVRYKKSLHHRHPSRGGWSRVSMETVSSTAENIAAPVGSNDCGASETVKRKVALHVGYVGTGYQGLQLSKQAHVKTIEGELLQGIHKAGLISDNNEGDLDKVKWSRSSRTDKGVHSLGTVVALKVIMDESRYESDPEGLGFAEAITEHLPQQISVFAVQRVNKHFRARHFCIERSYKYYLPVWVLTGDQNLEPGSQEELAALEKFRKALKVFEGRHPFHNFTKMKRYKDNPMDSFRGPDKDWVAPEKRKADCMTEEVDAEAPRKKAKAMRRKTQSLDEESDPEMETEQDVQKGAAGVKLNLSNLDSEKYEGWGVLTEEEKKTGRFRYWNFQYKSSQDAEKDGDVVVPAHYREVRAFSASDPHEVVTGGVRAICIEVVGVSFMLHQIRYMIATAVCVARDIVSFPVLEAMLNVGIRVNLALAPPHPLMLASNRFRPFPGEGLNPAKVSKWSGSELTIQSGGKVRQESFNDQVVLPAINKLLEIDEWVTWSKNLHLFSYNEAIHDVNITMKTYAKWHTEQMKNREARIKSFEERGIDKATYWKMKRENKGKKKAAIAEKQAERERKDGNEEKDVENSSNSILGWVGGIVRKFTS